MCVLVFSLTSDTFTSYYTYYGSLSNCSAKELRMLRYMYVSFYHALFMTNITSSKTCDTRPGLTDWSRPTCTSYALQENRKTCVVLGQWIFFVQVECMRFWNKSHPFLIIGRWKSLFSNFRRVTESSPFFYFKRVTESIFHWIKISSLIEWESLAIFVFHHYFLRLECSNQNSNIDSTLQFLLYVQG